MMKIATEDNLDSNSKMSVFNVKANRKVQREFIAQHERDKAYITELENLLNEKGVEIPEAIHEMKSSLERRKATVQMVGSLMADGSLEALAKSVDLIHQHTNRHEIQVQYRKLTFWSDIAKASIPTVGSTFKNIFVGGGKKERVNIINDLTGRILPKRMTLVMGPPGCGKFLYFFFSSEAHLISYVCKSSRQNYLPEGPRRAVDGWICSP